jgi:hypothetical protein
MVVYSLQAIDKYSDKTDHKGDVFNLGDLLADAGDDRLKNALKEFRDNQAKLEKAAGNLHLANKEILQNKFDPRNRLGPGKQEFMLGVNRSKTLITVANDYQAALDEYEKFVNKIYKGLSPALPTPRTMADSFKRCRDWAGSSRVLAENVQVYFEHHINGAIPVVPSKAKELVVLLGERMELTKEVDANQKIFDRERVKLNLAVAELTKAEENHNRAKIVNDRAVSDLAAQTTNLALRKLAVTEANEKSSLVNKRFVVIENLVKSYATDTAAKKDLNKASLALNAATNAFAVATNAVTKAKAKAPMN